MTFADRSWIAGQMLDALERWAGHYEVLREFGGASLDGRPDAVLVPRSFNAPSYVGLTRESKAGLPSWDRFGLVAVEMKTSRADALAGLRRGQFEQYRDQFAGLYVLIPHGKPAVLTIDELPEGVGLLVFRFAPPGGSKVICRKSPVWQVRPPSIDVLWRVLYEVQAVWMKRHDLLLREAIERREHIERRIGQIVAQAVYVARAKQEIKRGDETREES